MRPIALDTDASSLLYKTCLPPTLEAQISRKILVMTFVTCGELTEWTKSRNWGLSKRRDLFQWMDGFAMLPGTRSTARMFATLNHAAKRRGRPRPANDTWIAACCLARRVPLATLNVKDFHDFSVHHGLELITA